MKLSRNGKLIFMKSKLSLRPKYAQRTKQKNMNPETLAKSGTEHAHQTALFAWCAVARLYGFDVADDWAAGMGIEAAKSSRTNRTPVDALAWFHAVHNQGHGDRIRGAIAKAEGVRRGVPDTFLPWPVAHWHGLYIEMKKPTERPKTKGKGGVSDEQGAFGAYALRVGYGWAVCYSWREAADTLRAYIEWNAEA
jgi:hypothetical protein